jgi:hypothetical protein
MCTDKIIIARCNLLLSQADADLPLTCRLFACFFLVKLSGMDTVFAAAAKQVLQGKSKLR